MLKTVLTRAAIAFSSLLPIMAVAQAAQTLPVTHVDSLSSLPMPTVLKPAPLPSASATVDTQGQPATVTVTQTTTVSPLGASSTNAVAGGIETTEAYSREQVKTVVAEEIEEQRRDDDIEDGQAVAGSSAVQDDSAITNIVSRDGKTYRTTNLSYYAQQVNNSVWTPNMNKNSAMTVKLQALLDWNHASPGAIDGGWGMNSIKALTNFQAMHGLEQTGRLNQPTWDALTRNVDLSTPVVVEYTLTADDVNTTFANTPSGAEAKSKMGGLYYQNIKEMLGERFHMDVRYLDKLNAGKSYTVGETITVINVGAPLDSPINRVVASKADETLYAYYNDQLVATYPTTVGSSNTPSPHGTFTIVNRVKMPWYRATVGEGDNEQVYMLPPGPNNPVGVVWMGLSRPSYGIHGSPIPEGISRQASHGCIRLTNWDVLEVYANIETGATVELV